MENNLRLPFKSPRKIIDNIKARHPAATSVSSLLQELGGASPINMEDRELFYASVFCAGLNASTGSSKTRYFINIPEHMPLYQKEPEDFHLVDRKKYYQNQKKSQAQREFDHFEFQTVMITEQDLKRNIEEGNSNIYRIITDHLSNKKLKKQQYVGLVLLFHLKANIENLNIQTLREELRNIQENVFTQIWLHAFTNKECSESFLLELLNSNDPIFRYRFEIY